MAEARVHSGPGRTVVEAAIHAGAVDAGTGFAGWFSTPSTTISNAVAEREALTSEPGVGMSFAMRTLTLAALLALAVPAIAALTPGDSTRTLDHGGRTRQYLLHVPASYDGATAVPLVLDFHGFGSNAIQQRGISGMVAVSNREGFLLAHPDGINMTWNAGTCCGNFQIDDVGFIRAV